MNRGLSIALLIIGILLFVWGVNASESFSSDWSRFFTDAPTDKTIWLMIGGILAGVVGLYGLIRPGAKALA
ncbi:MAG: DUF3185 family protein [Planctomycetota bacterium]